MQKNGRSGCAVAAILFATRPDENRPAGVFPAGIVDQAPGIT